MPAASFQSLKAQRQAKKEIHSSPSSSTAVSSAQNGASQGRIEEPTSAGVASPETTTVASASTMIKSEPVSGSEAQAAAEREAKPDNVTSSTSQQPKTVEPQQKPSLDTFEPYFLPEEENASIQVRKTPARGRGLFWHPKDGSTVCRKGTTLLRLEPHVSVLSSSLLTTHCSACLRPLSEARLNPSTKSHAKRNGNSSTATATATAAAPSMRCSACKVVRYCSVACQTADWRVGPHKFECGALQGFSQGRRRAREQEEKQRKMEVDGGNEEEEEEAWRVAMQIEKKERDVPRPGDEPEEPGTDVRALARLVWSRQRLEAEGRWKEVEEQQSLKAQMDSARLQEAGQMALALAYYLGCAEKEHGAAAGEGGARPASIKIEGFQSASEMLDFICRFNSNAFTSSSEDLSPLGVSVCPKAALINHSCLPNAVIVFPYGAHATNPSPALAGTSSSSESATAKRKRCAHVVAIKDIKPGEEILTSYLDLSEPLHRRESLLQQRYLFKCDCAMCKRCRKTQKSMLGAIASVAAGKPHPMSTAGLWMDPREAVWCEKMCGGWVAVPFPKIDDGDNAEEDLCSQGTLSVTCQSCGSPQIIQLGPLQALRKEGIKAWKRTEECTARNDNQGVLSAAMTVLPQLRKSMPPSAFPLFFLLRNVQTACIEMGSSSSSSAVGEEDSFEAFECAMIAGLLIAAAMQTASEVIYTEGHPSRAISLATLGRLLLTEGGSQQRSAARSKPHRAASLFGLMPPLPPLLPPGPQRLLFGQKILIQALNELAIGFGASGKESTVHATMRQVLSELETELAFAAAAQRAA